MHTLSTLPYDIHHEILSHLTSVTVCTLNTEPKWNTGGNHPYLQLSLVSRSLHASVEAYCQHQHAVHFPKEKQSTSTHRTTYIKHMSTTCHYCGLATNSWEQFNALPCCVVCLYEKFPNQANQEDLMVAVRILEFMSAGVVREERGLLRRVAEIARDTMKYWGRRVKVKVKRRLK
ncbi:hypothetical protein K440DRAFT_679477 [Wilcoxina mikolae CBS 423.85]|nr:hypothetical protein K440DRAFT_679477 [Wilcoxina mikolae CBS 423.85]